jgi:hypothetical protein
VSTEVIYARVPKQLKEAADAYASQRGASLTKAVAELIDRGLTATSDAKSIEDLEKNLAKVRAERDRTENQLRRAKTEMVALTSFAERASAGVGTCPNESCGEEITGYDLLGAGHCRNCRQPLTSLVAPSANTPTLNQREIMILLGALGAVLGMAYISSK